MSESEKAVSDEVESAEEWTRKMLDSLDDTDWDNERVTSELLARDAAIRREALLYAARICEIESGRCDERAIAADNRAAKLEAELRPGAQELRERALRQRRESVGAYRSARVLRRLAGGE